LNHRFQVTVWLVERAEFQTVEIVAEDDAAASKAVARPGVEVTHVASMFPVLDWQKQVFNREEAGAYLGATVAKVDHLMAAGKLPRARDGRPLFTRRQLDAYVEEGKAA
jgi:hypothetical protein